MKFKDTDHPGIKIGFVLIPGFALTSFSLAVEAFTVANVIIGKTYYQITLANSDNEAIEKEVYSSNYVPILTQSNFSQTSECDLLFICAYQKAATFVQPGLFNFLRKQNTKGVTFGSLSSGSFILAKTGLLESGSCTVVNEHVHLFNEIYPDINIQENFFTHHQNILTCAGGTSALDMVLYMIGKHHGQDLVTKISQQFLQDRIRTEEQTQRATRWLHYRMKSATLGAAIEVMEKNIENPYQVKEIANKIGSTIRTVENAFRQHESSSPAKYYLQLRLQKARQLVLDTQLPFSQIAQATGFKSQSYFSKCFREQYRHSPKSLRITQ